MRFIRFVLQMVVVLQMNGVEPLLVLPGLSVVCLRYLWEVSVVSVVSRSYCSRPSCLVKVRGMHRLV